MHSDIQTILTRYWGYSNFRPGQEDIIRSVLQGNDTLALLPTGGGKSICFQVPALSREGICIVVSPLIALMKDQVENLKAKSIKASAIISGMSRNEIDVALENAMYGSTRFLYLSPERLLSANVRDCIAKMNVNLFAIDEAHCISQWGYDFRPPYLQIAQARELHPLVPVLALTATATPDVRNDIIEKLKFRVGKVFVNSFERKNICYIVNQTEDKHQRMVDVFNGVKGSAIVYVRNRKKTREITSFLRRSKISTEYYHAGLAHTLRNQRQEEWKSGKTRVMVCTNAFGMGIDKPDVRVVIHIDLPETLEAYYQEAGRAGRDGDTSYAILLYDDNDVAELRARQNINFPDVSKIKMTYQAIANYLQVPVESGMGVSYDFDLAAFIANYNLDTLTTLNCIRILETEGFISLTDAFYHPPRLYFRLNPSDLYAFQVENPKFDHLVKVILRSYDGIFDDFVKVNEKEIAKRSGLSSEEVIKDLLHLERMKVLNYEPVKDSPQLVFTEPRQQAEYLDIDQRTYLERKKLFALKTEAVISYATATHACRQLKLLDYFGEVSGNRCGTCDYCRQRNKLDLNEVELESLSTLIIDNLRRQPRQMHELINETLPPTQDRDRLVGLIRWMIDNGEIMLTEENLLAAK